MKREKHTNVGFDRNFLFALGLCLDLLHLDLLHFGFFDVRYVICLMYVKLLSSVWLLVKIKP